MEWIQTNKLTRELGLWGRKRISKFLLAVLCAAPLGVFAITSAAEPSTPEYSIEAIRYATSPGVPVGALAIGGPMDQKIDVAMVFWLIKGDGHTILFDAGYHSDAFLKTLAGPIVDYIRPDEAVKEAGIQPDEVTDIIISHAHWDHMGGIDLFPKATVWIQKEEYRYYTMDAWLPGGNHHDVNAEDVGHLLKLNTEGRVRLVDGDNAEIFPGIRAYTGAHHTYASQYLRVAGTPTYVLASDSCYLYLNLSAHLSSVTLSPDYHAANIAEQARMIELAGSPDRVVPGHDILQFQKFPTVGRVAKIK